MLAKKNEGEGKEKYISPIYRQFLYNWEKKWKRKKVVIRSKITPFRDKIQWPVGCSILFSYINLPDNSLPRTSNFNREIIDSFYSRRYHSETRQYRLLAGNDARPMLLEDNLWRRAITIALLLLLFSPSSSSFDRLKKGKWTGGHDREEGGGGGQYRAY